MEQAEQSYLGFLYDAIGLPYLLFLLTGPLALVTTACLVKFGRSRSATIATFVVPVWPLVMDVVVRLPSTIESMEIIQQSKAFPSWFVWLLLLMERFSPTAMLLAAPSFLLAASALVLKQRRARRAALAAR